MTRSDTLFILGLFTTAALVITGAAKAETNRARPHWIPNAMELQDELRQAGYVVVWGEGDDCQAEVLPENKVVVVCGENPVNDLRQAAWEVRNGIF